ncbi:MAG: hypothetical protein ACRD19_12480 [Terriglobia bacterium]
MSMSQTATKEIIPVSEYICDPMGPVSNLTHNWELFSGVPLTPAEDRTMVREPARAVPSVLAGRLGKVRVLAVPYIGCFDAGDSVCLTKPSGESHTAVWAEEQGCLNLVLACKELDAHDTGFEFLASIAQMALPKMTREEVSGYGGLIDKEAALGIRGEIDKESLNAKAAFLKQREIASARAAKRLGRYIDVSLTGTLAEYMHGLWHDVQIRVGPDYLPVQQLRERMMWLAGIFPPNPGYDLFAREFDGSTAPKL